MQTKPWQRTQGLKKKRIQLWFILQCYNIVGALCGIDAAYYQFIRAIIL